MQPLHDFVNGFDIVIFEAAANGVSEQLLSQAAEVIKPMVRCEKPFQIAHALERFACHQFAASCNRLFALLVAPHSERVEILEREADRVHARMDPIGLAFENFNALGMWRDKERKQPIATGGKLVTGESFESVRDLKRLLTTNHRLDYFRCLTEKLLTYAIGRGLEYYDVETVDEIVQRLH